MNEGGENKRLRLKDNDFEMTCLADMTGADQYQPSCSFSSAGIIMCEYITHDKSGVSVAQVQKRFLTFAKPPDEMVLENGDNRL